MTSAFEDDFAAGFADFDTEFGRTLTHRPLGVSANDVPVDDCLWQELEPERVNDEQGQRIVRRATLTPPSTVTNDERDQWVKSSEVWDVEAIRGPFADRDRLLLIRTEWAHRTTSSRGGF